MQTPSTKARIAIAACAECADIAALARQHGVAPDLIKQWRDEIWRRAAAAFEEPAPTGPSDLAILQAVSDASSDLIFAKDLQGRITFVNPATLALIGKPIEQVLGRTDVEYLADSAAAIEIMANDRRIMNSGLGEHVEEALVLPDGRRQIWLAQKIPFRDPQGQVVGLLGIARDITDRKLAEERVRTARDDLQRVLASITDGLAVIDRQWRYTYFSETGARMVGAEAGDMLGRCLWDVFPEADRLKFGSEFRRSMDAGVPTHFEEYYPEPLNAWIECHCYPSGEGLAVYFRDVTDRHLAQEAAQESERRVQALLEATPVGLAYADAGGHLTLMNAECKRLWGQPPLSTSVGEYAVWKGWWADGSDRHGQPLAALDWPMARALAGERVDEALVEIEPFDAPGTRRTVLLRSVPIQDDDGRTTGAVTAQMDISETLRAKAAVEESSQRLRQMANTIPQLAWMAHPDGHIHWYNDRWYGYTGTAPAQMEGFGWQSVHHPKVLPRVQDQWRRSLDTGKPFEMTFPLRGKDGRYRPFYTLVEPLHDAAGKVVQWFGTNTDVSALEAAQGELRKIQHWLQDGLNAGRMVAYEWDLSTGEIRYSDNVGEVTGQPAVPGGRVWDHFHPDDQPAFQAALQQAITKRSSFDQLTRHIRPDDGRMIWVQAKGHVLADEEQGPHCIRGILMDVTDQTLRQHALQDEGRRKDEFLAMLAHELRNPLAPISTAAQLLLRGDVDASRVARSAEIIARQTGHMTRMLDDLLDVSRVTRGLIELELDDVNARDIVHNAVEQAQALIEDHRHQLTVRLDPAHAVVRGDRIRLCQIIANLLTNSAKYTPPGGHIEVTVQVQAQQVRISVIDDGIGIDAALLPHVFELFTQASRTPDRSQGGLGLGLAVVRKLAQMHGGSVEAASRGPGQGSRFVVTLPLAPAPLRASATETAAAPVGPSRELEILVVDDNVDAAEALAAVLNLDGHRVAVVDRPSAALNAAREQRFDVLMLDIGMPEMDGYELARRLRAMPEVAESVLVAITGYGQPQDRVAAEQAGFDLHFVKPVDISRLQAALIDL